MSILPLPIARSGGACEGVLWPKLHQGGPLLPGGDNDNKYVVKHKSAKLFMTYAVGKLEAAPKISHLILSTSSQRVC